MGNPIRIDFGTQSSPGRYGPDTGGVHINAYVEKIEEGQPPLPIYSAPGLTAFATVTDGGACRGMLAVDDAIYTVSGSAVARVDTIGGVTSPLGGSGRIVGDNTAFVSMAQNAKAGSPQIALVVDGVAYFIEHNIVTRINSANLPHPNSVTFADQRVIYGIQDGRIFWSDIDDVTSIDALSFSTAEGAPDGLVRVFAHRLDLWLFGKQNIEIWRSTANVDTPFQRVSGGFIPIGCCAPFSVATLAEVIFWIGDDFIPYASSGYTPTPLVNPKLSRAIAASNKRSITAATYFIGGYGFYEISGEDFTWIYCASTQRWFQKVSYNKTRSRTQFASQLADTIIVGDSITNDLYILDQNAFDEAGDPLVWTLQSPPMHSYPNRISVDRLYADFVTGVGLHSTDDDESNPLVGLRWSDDGGQSFSRQMLKTLGAAGQQQTRVVWNNLGTTGRQGRIWEIQVSAPVIRGLLYAAIEGDTIGT